MESKLEEILSQILPTNQAKYFVIYLSVALFFLGAVLVYLVSTFFTKKIIRKLEKIWAVQIQESFEENSILSLLSIYIFAGLLYGIFSLESFASLVFISKALRIFLEILSVLLIVRFINIGRDILQQKNPKNNITIYTQIVQLSIYVLLLLDLTAMLLDRSFVSILTMLGAFITVVMLIFKDTLSSFMSGVQIQISKMFKIGDWIELPPYVDGVIIEMGLYNVKVENWDKTVSIVPTIKMVNEVVKNWSSIIKAKGRRIKRNIPLEPSSIRYVEPSYYKNLEKDPNLKNFLETLKEKPLDGLTNLDIFRFFIEYHLSNQKEDIWIGTESFPFLVRLLNPSSQEGLSIEIAVFSKKITSSEYEDVQSRLISTFYAYLFVFGLSPLRVN